MNKLVTALVAAQVAATVGLCACQVKTTPNDTVRVNSSPDGSPYTLAQTYAIQAAKSYIAMSGVSRAGLIDTLTVKARGRYDRDDIVFAVNRLDVDWREEAVQSARSFRETSNPTRAELIRQLTSDPGEQFTRPQAVYAADEVGLD